VGRCGVDSIGSKQESVPGSCEPGNYLLAP